MLHQLHDVPNIELLKICSNNLFSMKDLCDFESIWNNLFIENLTCIDIMSNLWTSITKLHIDSFQKIKFKNFDYTTCLSFIDNIPFYVGVSWVSEKTIELNVSEDSLLHYSPCLFL